MQYDYLIVGGGLSGLSMALELAHSGRLVDKRCLILEARDKYTQDKSWCGWHVLPHRFESCTERSWSQYWVQYQGQKKHLKTNQYSYRYMPALSFYEHCLDFIRKHKNIDILLSTKVLQISAKTVTTRHQQYTAPWVFDARPSQLDMSRLSAQDNYLLQCFYGWKVKSNRAIFNPQSVTLMDFPKDQSLGINFMYVLPLSEYEALVEPTYFLHHPDIPSRLHFLELVKEYMHRHYGCDDFELSQQEHGVLPMLYEPFEHQRGPHQAIKIGSVGGLLRPSTGYAFYAIQRYIKYLVANLESLSSQAQYPVPYSKTSLWMDQVFLQACRENTQIAAQFFYQLFANVNADSIARFLHDEAQVLDYFRVILAMPKFKFIRAALKHTRRKRQ